MINRRRDDPPRDTCSFLVETGLPRWVEEPRRLEFGFAAGELYGRDPFRRPLQSVAEVEPFEPGGTLLAILAQSLDFMELLCLRAPTGNVVLWAPGRVLSLNASIAQFDASHRAWEEFRDQIGDDWTPEQTQPIYQQLVRIDPSVASIGNVWRDFLQDTQ